MTGQSKDIAEIKKLAKDWNTGWDFSDTEALFSLYTNDPVLMPQGKPAGLKSKSKGNQYSL